MRDVHFPDGGGPLTAIDSVLAALAESGATAVCLGLPASWAFAAPIDAGGLPRGGRRTAMLYRLEEQLPLEAERMTADFLPVGGERALGVAVETDRVGEILDRLMAAGIDVPYVCATGLLALWQLVHSGGAEADYVLLTEGGEVNVFRMADRAPTAWRTSAAEAGPLAECLRAELLAEPAEVDQPTGRIIRPLPAAVSAAARAGVALVEAESAEPIALAARAAARRLAGEPAGWVHFRRDALAEPDPWGRLGRLLRAAAVLTVLLLAALAGSFYWRGMQYDAAARSLEARQVSQFHRVYPNQAAPPNVKSRLRSELALLSGVRGAGIELPDRPTALETLRRIAANMPPSLRLRIIEWRIEPSGIVLEGQVRQHTDAELIVRSLKQGGFDVDAPRTERLVRGGVAFTLTGRVGEAPMDVKPKEAAE